MRFSVLLSLYYKENPIFLRESLHSVFGQTLQPDEVILVEDGPLTPALYEVVEEFAGRYSTIKHKTYCVGKEQGAGQRFE